MDALVEVNLFVLVRWVPIANLLLHGTEYKQTEALFKYGRSAVWKTKVLRIGLIQHEMKRCKGDKF